MSAPEKPFACTSEGCKMSFTNEDHLMVHRKKHDMNLNLGLGQKSNIFVADQTPTPTRFIRNCEELGLFQDLQNVNPFEETFRHATELVKTGNLPTPEIATDDTLHTPHVFPIINDFHKKRAVSPPLKLNSEDDLKTPIVLKPDDKEFTEKNEKVPEDTKTSLILKENTLDEYFAKNNEELQIEDVEIKSDIISDFEETDNLAQYRKNDDTAIKAESHSKSRETVKRSIKEVIARNRARINKLKPTLRTIVPSIEKVYVPNSNVVNSVNSVSSVPLNTVVSNPLILNTPFVNNGMQTIAILPVQTFIPKVQLPTNNIAPVEPLPKTPPKKPANNSKKQSSSNVNENNKVDEKRQTIRIRNRAASFRSRNKRKIWVDSLVQENDKLNKRIEKLTKENASLVKKNISLSDGINQLQNEVIQLKSAFSNHINVNGTMNVVSYGNIAATSTNMHSGLNESNLTPAFQLSIVQSPALAMPLKRPNEISGKMPLKRLKPIPIQPATTTTQQQQPKIAIEKPKKKMDMRSSK